MLMYKNTLLAAVILLAAGGAAFWMYQSNLAEENQPAIPADQRTADLWETKTNEEGSVAVTVTPKIMSADDALWEFEIVLDTHSGDLGEDMMAVSSLSADNSEDIKPLSWDGDPPGGHHRSGILKFARPDSFPKTVTFKISGVGGAEARMFTWSRQ